jgi:hypothetical protein
LVFLNADVANAQKTFKSAPLFDFFKTYADSTIVLTHLQNVYEYPDYFIVSKSGDTINMYTYRFRNLIEPGKVDVPRAIARVIGHTNYLAMQQAPDINTLFEVKVVDKHTLNQLWIELMRESIWKIKDDSIDGEGCPIKKDQQPDEIFDAGGPLFKLITKESVKDLKFYAPNFYEEHCPGRAGRISALKIQEIFKRYFTSAGEKDFGILKKLRYLFKND